MRIDYKTLQRFEWAALFIHDHTLRGIRTKRVKDMIHDGSRRNWLLMT